MRLKLQSPITTNPRKVPTGTSYSAQGLAAPPSGLDEELGSSMPTQFRELVPELSSPYSRGQTFAKMMNDAGVDLSVRVWKTPVLGAEFFVDPYSQSDLDLEIAEFVEANLFGGMSSPFANSIEDIVHFCEDGYSILEKIYENRDWAPNKRGANSRTYTMLKKLGVRPVSNVKEIKYDNNGGPKEIIYNSIQSDNTVKEIILEISRIMVFTLNRNGGDLTGKSLLRTAYPHWYYKTHFYKIDAIQKERHSLGVPKGKLLPGFRPQDKTVLRNLLKNLRTNEESFMLLTPNVDVEFAELKGQLVNVLESAIHHNTMILMNVLAQFLALGVEGSSGGGRATAGAHSDLFMKALRYIANYIAEVINMYLIPELVVWNYKTASFPELKVRNVGDTRDLQMFASAIANLFAQEAVTGDERTENWLRQVFDMPAKQGQRPDGEQPGTENGKGQKGNVKQPASRVGRNVGKPPNSSD